jgi:hypothetical protein
MANVARIFVDLTVRNLGDAMAFFKKFGFTFNERFTDDTAACMVFAPTIYPMLLTEPKFKQFTFKKIADAKTTTE